MSHIIKNSILFFFLVILFSCKETPEELQQQISDLRLEKNELSVKKAALQQEVAEEEKKLQLLREKNEVYQQLPQGKQPVYLVKVRISQKRLSPDPIKHLKDGMNASTFWLPIDEDYYHSLEVGSSLFNDFRAGSLVINFSLSSWSLEVKEKKVEYH
ncbi:MAG: hypothetical protein H6765_08755 [Candidatus Peribacteria bacterium]|nr:MAG: hypothetical protein H6765_08755 [Candidatus Peribacteria bacterium]